MKAGLFSSYIILGTGQLIAITMGMQDWLEFHWLLCLGLAVLVAYTPMFGTVLATLGAVTAWHWQWNLAVGVFAVPMIILFGVSIAYSMRCNGNNTSC